MTDESRQNANEPDVPQAASSVDLSRIIKYCDSCNQPLLRKVTVDLDGYRVEFAAGQKSGTKVFDKAGRLIPLVVDVQVKHKCGKRAVLKLTMWSCPENDHVC